MTTIGEWLRRLAYLLQRGRMEDALQSEMAAHRAMMRVPGRFGHELRLRERARDVWGWGWLDATLRDVRFAARGLRRTPLFTLAAFLSLALGLALTASTVAVVNAYLIRSLPYPESDRLYHLRYAPPGPWEPGGMTALDWQSVADVVEYPIASAGDSFYLTEGGYTVALRGMRVTRGFVEGLGVPVAAGRRLAEQDFVAGAEPAALIGYAVWRDRFGADPSAIGRVIRTEPESRPGRPETYTVVGVLAPGFYFGRDSRAGVELLIAHPAPVRAYMVRLRDGVPQDAAERRLTEAARQAATSPLPADWTGVQLESARDRWIGNLRPVLFGVTLAVGLVLVIVCANVAVLMLLRAMQRQKEVAIRLALGSGWRHIARMLSIETSLIGAAAAAAGVALTAWVLRGASPLIEAQLGRPSPGAAGITVDLTVLLIVAAVSLIVVAAVSLAPLTSARRGLINALQQDSRVASDSRTMRRLRSGLIGFEIAGSLVLLIGCGLMIQSVVKMAGTDLGFEPHGLNASRIMLRARHYADAAAYRQFHERFAQSVAETAGSPVVFSSWPPFVPPPTHRIEADTGRTSASGGALAVSSGYFAAFGIHLRQGREFSDDEASTDAPVAIVSETLAGQLWPAGAALGRRVRNVEETQGGSNAGPWRTVIGVAADVRQAYDDEARGDFYSPRTPDGRYGSFYIRTSRPAPSLFAAFQQAAAAIDRDAVINPPRLVSDGNQMLAGTRFLSWLAGAFAGMAAFLSMLGIYGVTAYAVQQRSKEIAIRVALGASGRSVIRMFLREGALLLGAGTTAGLAGSALVSRTLRNQVFGVQSFDAPTWLAACLLLIAAGLSAVFWGARRAAAGDPVSTLNAG